MRSLRSWSWITAVIKLRNNFCRNFSKEGLRNKISRDKLKEGLRNKISRNKLKEGLRKKQQK